MEGDETEISALTGNNIDLILTNVPLEFKKHVYRQEESTLVAILLAKASG
jgi:hypothetical protein